jgi:biopolymer transport protein ExbD
VSARNGSGGFVRRGALHRWSLQFGPNMTPMVDIVLVILIFFMAAAAFIGEEWFLPAGIAKDPAREGASQSITEQLKLDDWRIDLLLEVDASGATICTSPQLRANKEPVDAVLARLATELAVHAGDETAVHIIPSFDVPYENVIHVHEACITAGAEKIFIDIQRSEG